MKKPSKFRFIPTITYIIKSFNKVLPASHSKNTLLKALKFNIINLDLFGKPGVEWHVICSSVKYLRINYIVHYISEFEKSCCLKY